MNAATKHQTYQSVQARITSVLAGESDTIARMATIACLLHSAFDLFYWTGFYRRIAPRELLIGPYQGTLGCLSIPFDKGVCGACASTEQTVIVDDTHLFPGHIACDPLSRSEIVLPVFDPNHHLIAVLDIDSTKQAAFDATDQLYLEQILQLFSSQAQPGERT